MLPETCLGLRDEVRGNAGKTVLQEKPANSSVTAPSVALSPGWERERASKRCVCVCGGSSSYWTFPRCQVALAALLGKGSGEPLALHAAASLGLWFEHIASSVFSSAQTTVC